MCGCVSGDNNSGRTVPLYVLVTPQVGEGPQTQTTSQSGAF